MSSSRYSGSTQGICIHPPKHTQSLQGKLKKKKCTFLSDKNKETPPWKKTNLFQFFEDQKTPKSELEDVHMV